MLFVFIVFFGFTLLQYAAACSFLIVACSVPSVVRTDDNIATCLNIDIYNTKWKPLEEWQVKTFCKGFRRKTRFFTGTQL
jgi:hypothetical protein